MDYGFNGGDEEAVRKEVTALGLEYSMMTSYTSFVAVMDEVRSATGEGRDAALILILNIRNTTAGSNHTGGKDDG